jgi:hypothetical protein
MSRRILVRFVFVVLPKVTLPITATFTGSPDSIVAGAMTYTGVDPSEPILKNSSGVISGTGKASSTYTKTPNITVTSATDNAVFAVGSMYSGNLNTVTTNGGTSSLYNKTILNDVGFAGAALTSTASSTLNWNATVAWPWAVSAISIQPDRNPPVTPMPVRVFAVGYNPSENGKGIAETYYQSNMGTLTPSQMEDSIFNKTKDAFTSLSNNMIQFSIVGKTRITTFQPYTDGFTYTLSSFAKCVFGRPGYDPTSCDAQKWKFDYAKWYKDNQICERAAAVNADEIWVIVPPYVMAYENIMVGPNAGFDINGPSYVFSQCKKTRCRDPWDV